MFYGLSVETLNVHGMASYNHQVLCTDVVVVPTHCEQRKIADYFRDLEGSSRVLADLEQLISNDACVDSAFDMLVLYYDVMLLC